MTGWLLDALPQAMAGDRVTAAFVQGCEEVADTIRCRLSTLEHQLDVDLASLPLLDYLSSWFGLAVEPESTMDASTAPGGGGARDAQRRLIRAVGQVLGRRGTRHGLETLLEALTGGRAEVRDCGGVFSARDPAPEADHVVRVALAHTGGLSERQILAFIAEEVPVGATVELTVLPENGAPDAG